MFDLAFVRANVALIEDKLRARGADAGVLADFARLDAERRAAITQAETLKAQRNALSEEFAQIKRAGGDVTAASERTRALKEEMAASESEATAADESLRALLHTLPNLPQEDVPAGASAEDNVCVKTVGEAAKLPFAAKPHWELGETLGILDFSRAAKISGSRFVVQFGAGARLERSAPGSYPSSLRTCSIATIVARTRRASGPRTITG